MRVLASHLQLTVKEGLEVSEYLVEHGVPQDFMADMAEGMATIMREQGGSVLRAAWVMRGIYQRVQEWVKKHKVLKHVDDQRDAISAFVKIWNAPGEGYAYPAGWAGYKRLTFKVTGAWKLRVHYQMIDGKVRLVWAGLKEGMGTSKRDRERNKLDLHEPFVTVPELELQTV